MLQSGSLITDLGFFLTISNQIPYTYPKKNTLGPGLLGTRPRPSSHIIVCWALNSGDADQRLIYLRAPVPGFASLSFSLLVYSIFKLITFL